MANQMFIPLLNPVRFYEVNPSQAGQYNTKQFDDYWQREQLRNFETPVHYKQKWQTNDSFPLQYESNFASINLKVIDCEQNIIINQNAVQVRANKYIPGFFVYENTVSWASVPPGTYYLLLTLGGTTKMISEPIELAEVWPNTSLFEYYNSAFHGDILFETGIVLKFRCESFLTRLDPGNERTAYRDQKMNPTILKSVPYRGWKLQIGYPTGVPDWVIDLQNWIWSCDNVTVDGKSFAVADNASFEEIEYDKVYPFRSWTLNVQEGFNRYSKIVNPELDTNKKIVVGGMIDSTLFGDTSENAGSNLVPINNIE
jgi:hypothetical protein